MREYDNLTPLERKMLAHSWTFNATCAMCEKEIESVSDGVTMVIMDGKPYHPACAGFFRTENGIGRTSGIEGITWTVKHG